MLMIQKVTLVIKPALLLASWLCFSILSQAQNANQLSLPEGSYIAGKTAFIDLQCNACHTVAGVELPVAEEMFEVTVLLGSSKQAKTSTALLTAIANPAHSLAEGYAIENIVNNGRTKMPDYNDLMTVNQLIDIITFLQRHYQSAD